MLTAPAILCHSPVRAGVRTGLGVHHGDTSAPAVTGGSIAVGPVELTVRAGRVGDLVGGPTRHDSSLKPIGQLDVAVHRAGSVLVGEPRRTVSHGQRAIADHAAWPFEDGCPNALDTHVLPHPVGPALHRTPPGMATSPIQRDGAPQAGSDYLLNGSVLSHGSGCAGCAGCALGSSGRPQVGHLGGSL